MPAKSLIARIGKALPVIIANAPALIEAAKQVRAALRRRRNPEPQVSDTGR